MVHTVILDLNASTPERATVMVPGAEPKATPARKRRHGPQEPPEQTHAGTLSTLKWVALMAIAWGAQPYASAEMYLAETWRRSDRYHRRVLAEHRPFPYDDNRSLRSQLFHEKNKKKAPWKGLIEDPPQLDVTSAARPTIAYPLGDDLPRMVTAFDSGLGVLACMMYASHIEQHKISGMVPLAQMASGQVAAPAQGRPLTEYGLIAQLPVVTMTSAHLARVTAMVMRYVATHRGNSDLLGSFLYQAMPAEASAHPALRPDQFVAVLSIRLRQVLAQALMACLITEAVESEYGSEVEVLRATAQSVCRSLDGLETHWLDLGTVLARSPLPVSERLKSGPHPQAARDVLVRRVQNVITTGRWQE
ncbi:hypothetical protein [uncultured Deinococcus sp.]|uniref:hypothetical protein n=1 Tax=uncultured Deinococcus sp. TaxID=158789 RepID=UPI0025F7FAEB|nr:hypothetical protein [uncultured Deinococcus sp.]